MSMSVLPARERARTGHSFKTVKRHDFSDVSSLVEGGSRSRGGHLSGLKSCARWRPVVQWCAECRRPVGEDPHDGPGCWQREQAQHTRSTPPDE